MPKNSDAQARDFCRGPGPLIARGHVDVLLNPPLSARYRFGRRRIPTGGFPLRFGIMCPPLDLSDRRGH